MRALLLYVVSAFGSLSLIGCGGSSFQGTTGGGGNGPQPDKNQPVVTGLNPSTVVAGGPSFTLTVTGKNFAQGDTVEWSSFPLNSTFVSSTQMSAVVPNTLLYETGTISIIVQTPTPYSINFGTNLTITAPPPPGSVGFMLSSIGVQANDILWDSDSQQLYMSVAATDSSHANTITALDPLTGNFGASTSALGDRLAVSSDHSWLYVGIDGNGEVRRFSLPNLASDITIPLGTDALARPKYAVDIEPAPGTPGTIAVSQTADISQAGEVVIYDGATARAQTVSDVAGVPHPLGSIAWNSSGTSLYGVFDAYAEDTLAILNIDQTGVNLAQSVNLNPTPSSVITLGKIHRSALTGYLYGDNGQVIDPISRKVVNQLPLNAVAQGIVVSADVITLDDTLGIAWVLGQAVGGQQYVIEAFDLKSSALLGSIAIGDISGTPVKLIRWGSNGLAFITTPVAGQQASALYILSGAFVTTPTVQVRAGSFKMIPVS